MCTVASLTKPSSAPVSSWQSSNSLIQSMAVTRDLLPLLLWNFCACNHTTHNTNIQHEAGCFNHTPTSFAPWFECPAHSSRRTARQSRRRLQETSRRGGTAAWRSWQLHCQRSTSAQVNSSTKEEQPNHTVSINSKRSHTHTHSPPLPYLPQLAL